MAFFSSEIFHDHSGVRYQCGQLKQLDSMTNSEIRVLKFFIA